METFDQGQSSELNLEEIKNKILLDEIRELLLEHSKIYT